ncbi:hypothetical protein [Flavobacterium sp.]|uniref:hypothetical protein n=1 Tax=Flavobacterium sp. TaxID=239 RepID=UPI00260D72E0|nr:hypothetical protein [Flavobacterium sp.]
MFKIHPERNTSRLHFIVLLSGVFLIIFSIQTFRISFTTEDDLVAISGKVFSTDMYITSSKSFKTKQTHYSSNLIVTLSGNNRLFKITEPEKYSEKLQKIKAGLKKGNVATIYIKKKDIIETGPKIYRIDAANKTLLSLEDTKSEDIYVAMFSILAGIALLVVFLYLRYPNFAKKYI